MGDFSGGITGAIGGFFGSKSDIYGRRPKVPGAIDYTKNLQEAIATNKKLLPELSDFAKLSTEEMANVLETAFPGYKSIRSQASENIGSYMRGEVPKDVQTQLEQKAAERGQTLGYGGSQFGENQFLRNFGLTSLQLTQQGLDSASRWIQQAQNLSFDFSKFFLGKEEAMRRTEFNWQRDWLAAQVKASPDPRVRGAFDSEMALIGEVLSAYGGGAGYQGTYRQSYGGAGGARGGGGTSGGSYFGGGGPVYGSVYQGAGGQNYMSVPTDTQGGGMSVPFTGA